MSLPSQTCNQVPKHHKPPTQRKDQPEKVRPTAIKKIKT